MSWGSLVRLKPTTLTGFLFGSPQMHPGASLVRHRIIELLLQHGAIPCLKASSLQVLPKAVAQGHSLLQEVSAAETWADYHVSWWQDANGRDARHYLTTDTMAEDSFLRLEWLWR